MTKRPLINLLITLLATFIFIFPPAYAGKKKLPPRPTKAIQQFVHQMVRKYQFNRKKLTAIMIHAQYVPKVIHSITYPFEKKPWNYYRKYFLTKGRIEGGVKYWGTHLKTLNAVKKQYGVDPSVIIAIIGVESKFGRHMGGYNELNSLSTLAFYYPKRSRFFKKELVNYLLLTRKQKLPVLKMKGSYAGALGIPQFMPSSYRYYGVDYSKNHSIDLLKNHNDAIASIANYLKKSGWRRDQSIATPAKIIGKVPKQFISRNARPQYLLSQLEAQHIYPVEKEAATRKAALIAMQNTNSTEYWIVFRNFYAIMKYNPRTTYALAVFELSRSIQKAYKRQQLLTPKLKKTSMHRVSRHS